MIAAGALGDPALVPWLCASAGTPAVARLAGEAFATITGAAIEGSLEGKAPDGFEAGPSDRPEDADVTPDRDWQLRWPAPEALGRWWSTREGGLRRGVRHLAGAPLSAEGLGRELDEASQRRRLGAALELALQKPGRPLAEVRGRAT